MKRLDGHSYQSLANKSKFIGGVAPLLVMLIISNMDMEIGENKYEMCRCNI